MRTKNSLSVLLGMTCLLASSLANAQPYQPKVIPQCERYKLADGREVCGYDSIEKVRQVYNADAELVAKREAETLHVEKSNLLLGQVANLRLAVDAQKRATGIIRDRNRELTAQLIETDRKYQNERAKPRWGNPIAWTIAATCAAALAGGIAWAVLD